MKANMFFNELFFPFLLNIIILIFLLEPVLGQNNQNPKFRACEPKKCGNNNPTISYPFWIDDEQESYCGHPNFKESCTDHKIPILRISDGDYLIRDISYENHSLVVTNAAAIYDKPSCPIPHRNFTLVGSPFSFTDYHIDLYFFYNCSLVPTQYFVFPIPCARTSNKSLSSYATIIHEEGGFKFLNSSSEKCESLVGVPIEMEEGTSLNTLMTKQYSDLVKEGFVLTWNSSVTECNDCQRSGGRCGSENTKFVCFFREGSHQKSCNHDPGPRRNKIIIGVCAAIGASLLTVLAFILFRRWRRRNDLHKNSTLISRSISPDLSMQPDPEKGSSYFNTPIFTYKELEEATNNFDSSKELGDGGFGTVYYGKLKDGRAVAVKRLYENNCKRVEQFMNEVNILSLLRHQNLVSLYGCTSRHSRELLLVYEYVANGTVADHLHGEHSSAGMVTWPIRLSIAIESADALVYLHASDIIHRDVKTNNILLDKNFHVKVADFGLSRLFPNDVTHVSTAPQGTPGYVDPDYYQCYQLTDKSDVYSFGVVLCELISSKPAVDINRHRHEINLSTMALNKIHGDALHELVDMSLGFDTNASVRKTVTLVAELAYRCLQQDTDARPSMAEVLEVLKEIEVEGSKVVKPGELTDDAKLLKNYPPVSPNSVTDKWASITSTPNTSS
ncbi:LEAF RUST 10 DISEASE-RESISTANCE LOCUS RECEPTOR-LIKE PROTEIN KINASE-like 1.2 isoform X2 [Papaver somniferum]|uniref:LEAF RUST 10 DISEASE-RESISTANCE LOCUS RECEPTOR-LIKE PROTEIN KINASE-like 1.2 isoform X2 n=1 Tax=Papaver somniferum TaxID=3469 RepID=UPI000E6FE12B|nr:LEAF RUST 10 DISEASE-RESISTANCE LOCUS RECEPTOR-LIKE PROTEIN KINASE-like 1.2 isoform X2 [Papaver somniferum]